MNTLGLINEEMPEKASRPKLLLADDSVTIRRVVELTFADEGIDVTTVADAASAMEKFVEIQPDIVLVDVGLAGTSGYQICEMIKQDEATRHIPVLLLVGSFEPFDQDQAEFAGADGFLTKPFQSIRELVARVSELLSPGTESAVDPVIDADPEAVSAEDGRSETEKREAYDESVPPEVADIENLYQRSFVDTAEIEEFDTVDDLLGDAGLDDELIEASYQSGQDPEKVDRRDEPVLQDTQTKDFSWTPAEANLTVPDRTSQPQPASTEEDLLGKTLSDIELPIETERVEPADEAGRAEPAEPSPEFIALVAQRVVERLSDKAVRDIAKEAVPRIAEKLIREALAEEKKA
jgi:CheY-like chemotaxis protein